MKTLDDKIYAMETILHIARYHSSDETYRTLKEVAKDLRAQQPEKRSQAIDDLVKAIESAKAVSASSQKEQNKLMHVGQTTIQHWPVIRQALEKFGDDDGS